MGPRTHDRARERKKGPRGSPKASAAPEAPPGVLASQPHGQAEVPGLHGLTIDLDEMWNEVRRLEPPQTSEQSAIAEAAPQKP